MTTIFINMKKHLLEILYKIAIHFRTIKINPYKLRFKVSPPDQLSDLFIYSKQFVKVTFTAENTLAILQRRPVLCIHKFVFFDSSGSAIDLQQFKTSDYTLNVEFKPLKNNEDYISFCHHIEYADTILKEYQNFLNCKFTMLHRGYTSYWQSIDSIPHIVHGNYGAITEKLISTSRLASKHIYTPSFCFNQNSAYHLVFNNPCDVAIRINLQDDSGINIAKLKLASLATTHFELRNYDGLVHIISQLPICRPVIFQNPPICSNTNFDVLHS
jgi:hypothetical protein